MKLNLKQVARQAAQAKVVTMPEPPKEPKGRRANAPVYDPTHWMQRKPRLEINSMQLPAVKEWHTGETYPLLVNATMTGYNQDAEMKGHAAATFEIQQIAVLPHGSHNSHGKEKY